MSEHSEKPGKSYIPNRDNTAGRNNDNPQLTELDQKYRNDDAREGTNSKQPSFGEGKRY